MKNNKPKSELSRSEQLACLILFLGWLSIMVGLAAYNL